MILHTKTINDIEKIEISDEMAKILAGIWHKRLSPGAVAFTYLAARTFGVVRYPTRPDRSVDLESDNQSREYEEAVDLLDKYSEPEWQQLQDELMQIHNRTKNALNDLTSGQPIELERAIVPMHAGTGKNHEYNRNCDEIDSFPMLAQAALMAGVSTVEFDVDIVSGWSIGSLQRYGSLHLKRNWPLTDIIIVSDLLERKVQNCTRLGPLESNEWLCLNRNPKGFIQFNVADFKIDEIPKAFAERLRTCSSVVELATKLQAEVRKHPTKRRIAARPPLFTKPIPAKENKLARGLDWLARKASQFDAK